MTELEQKAIADFIKGMLRPLANRTFDLKAAGLITLAKWDDPESGIKRLVDARYAEAQAALVADGMTAQEAALAALGTTLPEFRDDNRNLLPETIGKVYAATGFMQIIFDATEIKDAATKKVVQDALTGLNPVPDVQAIVLAFSTKTPNG